MASQFYPDETFQLFRADVRRQGQRYPVRVGKLEIREMKTSGMPVFVYPCILFADIHLGKQRDLFLLGVFHCSQF